jgi:hypothetical protein
VSVSRSASHASAAGQALEPLTRSILEERRTLLAGEGDIAAHARVDEGEYHESHSRHAGVPKPVRHLVPLEPVQLELIFPALQLIVIIALQPTGVVLAQRRVWTSSTCASVCQGLATPSELLASPSELFASPSESS